MRPSAPAGLADRIGGAGAVSLELEASLEPKPGLVDPLHRGAHADMDYRLLVASARALEPTFRSCAEAGTSFGGGDPRELLALLRPVGLAGEAAMLEASGGVNTHRGAIFCLGLLSAAAARCATQGGLGRFDGDEACLFVKAMCDGIVAAELGPGEAPPTGPGRASPYRGGRLYREWGARGPRGEAEDGFPVLRRAVLPRLRAGRGPGERSEWLSRLDALLGSMAELEDSCVLARGGRGALDWLRERAASILAAGGAAGAGGLDAIRDLDRELCARGLSPGGSADMLAAGIFLEAIERAASRPTLTSGGPTAPAGTSR